jgi:predicted short-subunit dehydrogenase-like oxidoreductase (DUF2520 family)
MRADFLFELEDFAMPPIYSTAGNERDLHDLAASPCSGIVLAPDILRAMRRRVTIAIVGAGNLGTALAVALDKAGYRVREIVSRPASRSGRRARMLARKVGARLVVVGDSKLTSDVVWLCVPDREIAECARSLSLAIKDWTGKIVLHASGSLTSDELNVLRTRGASVASAHPLMTFVRNSQPSLKGVGFAVEGDRAAVRAAREIVALLGGKFFAISKERKAAYHAWATFVSPLLTALFAVAERVAKPAGMRPAEARRRMTPILRQTIDNYEERGAAASFSGPIIRGDAATVAKHLRELQAIPAAAAVYRELASGALQYLPVKNRKAVAKALEAEQLRGKKKGAKTNAM